MKINSSTINMGSNRTYGSSTEVKQVSKRTNLSTGQTVTNSNAFLLSYKENYYVYQGSFYDDYRNSDKTSEQPLVSDLYSNLANNNVSLESTKTSLQEMHEKLIREIETFMERIRNQLLGLHNQRISSGSILDLTSTSNQPGTLWARQESTSITYTETENTTFSSTGCVKTEDGRSIDFNISMEMSRSFMETSESLNESVEYLLTDPLVIHLKDAPEAISDQTFLFDLDCDGKKEEMSQLANGSGFLALDRNGNGIIDDGSELFGTKSGNGFQDLAAYDDDGNGWIDENDAIYSQLKIWSKDENGNDKLMDLKQADVGAIYLGSASTQFSHNDLATNDTLAMVRKTGLFLHESTGDAGTIQQIDFATKKQSNEVA